jgi:prepilin-type N-terminal cleavage/methylation domain-containing protein
MFRANDSGNCGLWIADCGLQDKLTQSEIRNPKSEISLTDCGLWIADCGLQSAASQSEIRNPKSEIVFPPSAFTLVEMLVAMAITLVMMGAVVTLFANITNSVRDRRAVIEISGQLRHARNMLQQDLQGATCPGLTWRRPEENQGYIEIIEGPYREGNASILLDYDPTTNKNPPASDNPEIDHTTSIIPTSNLLDTTIPAKSKWVTDGAGLGDGDDILMLTVRNEHEPFVGNMPSNVRPTNAPNANANRFADWGPQTIESPLAEVVWYAVENPGFEDQNYTDKYNHFFGEPGMRTIYRRTLLIAPWVNPYRLVDNNGNVHETFTEPSSNGGKTFNAKPGLVRVLPNFVKVQNGDRAIAALIAFQERYDLSVRLEFDPLLDPDISDPTKGGRWTIVANTLGDLTKRENRYEHHSFVPSPPAPLQPGRFYPFAAASTGNGYSGGSANLIMVNDPELQISNPPSVNALATANLTTSFGDTGVVGSFTVTTAGKGYPARPFAYVNGASNTLATARIMLDDDGEVVQVIPGLVPLSGSRRGEDVMLSDALAFDLRVYDPGAPLFGVRETPGNANSDIRVVLEPSDPAWWRAYEHSDNMNAVGSASGSNLIGNNNATYPFVGQGAYVDLGYGFIATRTTPAGAAAPPALPAPAFANAYSSATKPWFFSARPLSHVNGNALAPGYAVYDTWSFHYENDGVDEDGDGIVDQGTNGLDDKGYYYDTLSKTIKYGGPINGPDDVGERETAPPYDKPLRGVQAILRVYERDSRQIRQVSVTQHFVPE